MDFYTKLNNSTTMHPIVTKFYPELRLSTPERTLWPKWNFGKLKMAAGCQLMFINMAITSKRLVRKGPNLAEITSSVPPIGKYHKNLNFWNPRWPPSAILENPKTQYIRSRLFDLHQIWTGASSRHPIDDFIVKNEICTKFKMAAAHQLKFTNIAIKAKWLFLSGSNLARITHPIIKQQILM